MRKFQLPNSKIRPNLPISNAQFHLLFSCCLLLTPYCLLIAGCAKKGTVIEGYKDGVWLGFKFVPGVSVCYKQTQNITTTIEAKQMAQTFSTLIELRTTHTVEDTSGSNISLSIRFDDVLGTIRVGNEIESIKELDELTHKTISLKLSMDGKITELKGLEEVDYFRKSGERPEEQFEELFSFLPNRTVKIGDTWTRKFEDKITTYTLKGFEKRAGAVCARIEVSSDVDLTKTVEQQGMQAKLKLSGKEKGEILFDVDAGVMLESKSTASLEGEQELKGPTPMSLPIYIDQYSRTELIQ